MAYINKKTIPDYVEEVNYSKLNKLLKQEIPIQDSYEIELNYNNQYLFTVENTYNYHKTKGTEFKVNDIYVLGEEGKILYKLN